MNKHLIPAAWALAAVLSACVRLSAPCDLPWQYTQTIQAQLPDYPSETHPPVLCWSVYWYDGAAVQRQTVFPDSTGLELTVPKNKVCPIVFYPCTRLHDDSGGSAVRAFFRPAAALYPVMPDTAWEQGPAGELLLRLLSAGNASVQTYCSRFNWLRLHEAIIKKTSEAQGTDCPDPWRIDTEQLLAAIAQEQFSVHDIQCLSTEESNVSLPEPCTGAAQDGTSCLLLQRYVPLAAIEAGPQARIMCCTDSSQPEQAVAAADGGTQFYQLREVSGADGTHSADMRMTVVPQE